MEYLRVDHANHLLGLRLNDWTCLVVFSAAFMFLATSRRSADAEIDREANETERQGIPSPRA